MLQYGFVNHHPGGDEDDWFDHHGDAGQDRDVDKTRREYLMETLVSDAANYLEIQQYVDVY